MDTNWLITFIKVADIGSFSAASNKLFVSNVSIMRRINNLENEVGVKLVNRSAEGITLTPAGKGYYRDAKKLLLSLNNMNEHAQKLGMNASQSISIGTSIMRPCQPFLAYHAEKTREAELSYTFHITSFDDTPDGIDNLISVLGNTIDLFVGPCDHDQWANQFNRFIFSQLPCRIAVPRSHPLSGKARLTWNDLEGCSFLLIKQGISPILDNLRDEIISQHPGIRIVDCEHPYDLSTFNYCDANGYLMETLDIWKDIHPGLITLPMEWNYAMPNGIVYSKKPSPKVKMLLKNIGALQK